MNTPNKQRIWRGAAALSVLVGAALSLTSCDTSPTPAPSADARPSSEERAEPKLLAWAQPDAPLKTRDLRTPEASLQARLTLTPSETFPSCAELFEADGHPKPEFPLTDDRRRPLQLAGCAPEAYRRLDDGTRYIAYATPLGKMRDDAAPREPLSENATDLRLLAYQPDGQLAWHATLDRSANAKNFRANFRDSYIAPLLPRLVCFGTRWQGGTQASCVQATTGEVAWSGTMPFWSGIVPQPNATSLVGASLKRLTRRYPYSGVEMRAITFDDAGGRSSFYAAHPGQLFFASAHAKSPRLSAYDLDDFSTQWTLELPGQPDPNWAKVFADLDLLMLKIDDTIFALGAQTGARLWAARVGADASPVVARKGRLYLLLRRQSAPNDLFEIAPDTGAVTRFSPLPNGTLDLLNIEDTLVLRSVRAVQQVDFSDDAAQEAAP